MKYLLDTQIVLWLLYTPRRLPRAARAILEDPANTLVFSTVCLWEIGIKRGLGREDFQVDPRQIRRTLRRDGFEELPILGEHAEEIDTIPRLHKDPFDRMLVAQAMVEGITLLTADRVLARYPGPIRKV